MAEVAEIHRMCLLHFKPRTHGRIAVFRPAQYGEEQIAVLSIPEQFIATIAEDITEVERSAMKSALADRTLRLSEQTPEPRTNRRQLNASKSQSRLLDKQAYTLSEVAELTGFSRATVAALFKDEPGVLRLGHGETMHKRKYHSVRIPQHVYERVVRRLSR